MKLRGGSNLIVRWGKNRGVVFKRGARLKITRERSPCESLQSSSLQKTTWGGTNLQISCDAVLDPPPLLSIEMETGSSMDAILAQLVAYFSAKQLTPEPHIAASFRAKPPQYTTWTRPLHKCAISLVNTAAQPPQLTHLSGLWWCQLWRCPPSTCCWLVMCSSQNCCQIWLAQRLRASLIDGEASKQWS